MGAAEGTYIEPFVLTIRGRVRLLPARRHDEAEADLRRVVALCDARGWAAPNATRGRLRLAEVLAAAGRHDEALALMDHDIAAAQAAERPGSSGWRCAPRAPQKGDGAIASCTTPRALLAPTCTARARLGAARPRRPPAIRGDRRDAREPLRQALELAPAPSPTAGPQVRGELEASGARPRRERMRAPRRSRRPSGASPSWPPKG